MAMKNLILLILWAISIILILWIQWVRVNSQELPNSNDSDQKKEKLRKPKIEIRKPNANAPEDYYLEEEKHFDCVVEEITKEDQTKEGVFGKYSVVTECGILFYTNQKYKIGDVLKGFDSPQHK